MLRRVDLFRKCPYAGLLTEALQQASFAVAATVQLWPQLPGP